MGCHIYDPVFKALDLTSPLSLKSIGPKPNNHNWAINAEIRYTFPGNKFSAGKTVDVTWYDGDKRPPKDIQGLLEGKRIPSQGSIFIGTNGAMLLPHMAILSFSQRPPLPTLSVQNFPRSTTGTNGWKPVKATELRGLTLNMLVHLLRQCYLAELRHDSRCKELKWDTKKLEFTNEPKAAQYVRLKYRKGWEVEGL